MIIIWKYKRGKFQSAVSLLARDSQRNILFISSSSCAVPVYCTDIFIGSLLNSRHSVEGLPCNTNSHPLFFPDKHTFSIETLFRSRLYVLFGRRPWQPNKRTSSPLNNKTYKSTTTKRNSFPTCFLFYLFYCHFPNDHAIPIVFFVFFFIC